MNEQDERMPSRDDLLGASRLTIEAVTGVTDLVEAVHQNILKTTPGRPLGGVTSWIYRAVKGVTRLVGGSLEFALRRLAKEDQAGGQWPGRDSVLAALNGVLGDHLELGNNPLAIPLRLYRAGGVPLSFPVNDVTDRVVVMVHGLCMNDLQWQSDGGGLGEMLARERGFTCLYLRYNTGRHIAVNGAAFAAALESLVAAWPVELKDLTIVGHSMGGLVARSACWHGEQAGHRWRSSLRRLVTLGSPHKGAPLERGGNWVTLAAGLSNYSAPFARLAKLRSAGITDLRHGSVLAADWEGVDRFAKGGVAQVLPLPQGVACFALAATLAKEAGGLADALAGDGLVPVRSALGIDKDPALCLQFQASATVLNTGHMALLSSPEVARQLLAWC